MEERRTPRSRIALAVLAGFLAALLLFTGLAWALLGTQGISLLAGWGIARLGYIGEYDPDNVADYALAGLVNGLGDRWSYYVNAEGYQSLMERRSNSYVGIGVTVSFEDERGLHIVSVRKDGPAQRSGLTAEEIITAVDGVSIAGDARYDASDRIQGEAGTQVVLTVLGTDGAQREVTVTRMALHVETVRSALLESGGKKIGYVALANFSTGASGDVITAVNDLVSQGAQALLFDMRNNGGGYVDELTAILDYLLPAGDIFRSQTRWGREQVVTSGPSSVDLPMGTLVNGNTYSAAELFAAQLKESVGAFIVGEETSGKGYFQNTIPLPNGGALNVSLGRYTTGGGVSLVGTGVDLDVQLALSEEDATALAADALEPEEDAQIQAALKLFQ